MLFKGTIFIFAVNIRAHHRNAQLIKKGSSSDFVKGAFCFNVKNYISRLHKVICSTIGNSYKGKSIAQAPGPRTRRAKSVSKIKKSNSFPPIKFCPRLTQKSITKN